MDFKLSGMHHVSSLSAHIGRTRDFYTRVLGLRPVITTVNQDDTSMYHLFFADGKGSPGSDMTVFDLPHAAPEHRGNNAITLTTFRVGRREERSRYWDERLTSLGVAHGEIYLRDGRAVLDFDDPVGTQLSLIDDRGVGESFPWADSPVPLEHQIRGLGYVAITVPDLAPTDHVSARSDRRRSTSYVSARRRAATHVHVYRIGDAEHHVIVRSAARVTSSVFQVRRRLPLAPPLSAVINSRSVSG